MVWVVCLESGVKIPKNIGGEFVPRLRYHRCQIETVQLCSCVLVEYEIGDLKNSFSFFLFMFQWGVYRCPAATVLCALKCH